MTEIVRHERNLRQVFWQGDALLNARVARLCVLYEDLRIEVESARHMIASIAQLMRDHLGNPGAEHKKGQGCPWPFLCLFTA